MADEPQVAAAVSEAEGDPQEAGGGLPAADVQGDPQVAERAPIQLTNEQLKDRLARAERRAHEALLRELGVESPEDLKAHVEEARKAKQAKMTAEERVQAELADSRLKLQTITDENTRLRRENAFILAAQEAGVPADRIADAFLLAQADWSDDEDAARVVRRLVAEKGYLTSAQIPGTRAATGRNGSVAQAPIQQPETHQRWNAIMGVANGGV